MERVERAPSNIVVSTVLLSKPGIIVSVAFTGFAGIVLAAKGLPSLSVIVLTIIALLLSAAGSAILNNVLDKQIDLLMNRLSKRAQALEVVGEKTAGHFCFRVTEKAVIRMTGKALVSRNPSVLIVH